MAGNIRPSGDGYLVGTYTAAAAISRGQVVQITAEGTVNIPVDARQPCHGVALEDAASGAACTVVRGYCFVLAGGAIAAEVGEVQAGTSSSGKIGAAGDNTTTNRYVVGQILADATADGDLVPCFVSPYLSAADHS